MIEVFEKLLFYLLLLLLPTQLGRHFFFDFSLLSGIRNDYLAPTIYFTDLIVFSLFTVELFREITTQGLFRPKRNLLLFIICYLLFNALVVSANKWVALYKFIKIIEFTALGVIILRIKPRLESVVSILSLSLFYSSVLAVWQFIGQKSVGGLFYWLGERTFTASTPGIAALSAGGRLMLRPYATFPHPNVLGGFLAIVLPVILFILFDQRMRISNFMRLWLTISFTVGLGALILSFSRTAGVVFLVGLTSIFLMKKTRLIAFMRRRQKLILAFFYGLIFFSVGGMVFFKGGDKNFQERTNLINGALNMVLAKPLFGVGLNNSIMQLRNFVSRADGLYVYQPIHNIYLLTLSELGLAGFFLFLIVMPVLYQKILSSDKIIITALIQLGFLGMFDHYLLTLQQGQLLLTVFISLALIPRVELN